MSSLWTICSKLLVYVCVDKLQNLVCVCVSCRGLCVWAPLRAFLMRDLRQALEQNHSADQKHRLGLADLHNAASAERPQLRDSLRITCSPQGQTERRGHLRAWTHSHHPWPHLKQQPLLITTCLLYVCMYVCMYVCIFLFSHLTILLIDLCSHSFIYLSYLAIYIFYWFIYLAIYFRHMYLFI